ncbi:hypothetical protein [Streptomyces lichenis]|uniref:Uncharacterized protein n=1 Tax=Streptomyces lichenis TaxID=2306967 RepID=A0ABT0IAV3_9ACTN|nr:hypothetical protein [Streptomyces lichenis]MCK8678448.1 hypothetical protein [Streptomyces lichenis]
MTGGREPSPGWTEEQKAAVDQLRRECLDLSATVLTHPYGETFQGEEVVKERMRLMREARPEKVVSPSDMTTAA